MAMRKYGTAQDAGIEVEAGDLVKEAKAPEWTPEDEDDLMGETED